MPDAQHVAQPHAMNPSVAAANDPSMLTLDRLFSSEEFQEKKIGPMVWSRVGPSYFTLEPAAGGGPGRDLVRHDAASGAKTIVVAAKALLAPGAERPLTIDGYEFSADESKVLIFTNSRKVWRLNTRGDYWVVDLHTRQLQRIGGDAAPSTLMFAKFSPAGDRVAYVRENNLYVQVLATGQTIALTTDGSPTRINGTSDWVNEEELHIRDGYRWSPDGRSIAFWQFDASGVGVFHLVNNTAELYPKITSFPYPKVGQTNSATRIGVVSAAGGPARWLDLPGHPREHYVPRMEWTPDGSQVLVQQMNRLQNTNRVMLADPATGVACTVHTDTDAAWVDNDNPVRWTHDRGGFVWLSEQSGWRHAYNISPAPSGAKSTPITRGDFDVIDVDAVDPDTGEVYFSASADEPTGRYLYRVRLSGGMPQRISPVERGWHAYDISPDARWAIHTFSSFTTPSRVELVRLPSHEVVRVMVDNAELKQRIAALRAPKCEFFRVDIGEGVVLDGWCVKPPGCDPAKKYPLLFHVYGEPASQIVRDRWPGVRGLWHWMLAQQGCIVVAVDNRGTPAPRGRDWRKVVYRQIGILAPQEQAAAARQLLKDWPFVDPARVGIWGWSGGGSMSLNAIFRYPELYRTAIAVAPNANQLLYDTIYQERYMGLPTDNAAGYRDGSPLTHAHRLEGNLLIVHGTGDDNGHYQGTELLINELIKHGNTFTVMPYPNRSHAIAEGDNTVRHFYGLLTGYVQQHLLSPATP